MSNFTYKKYTPSLLTRIKAKLSNNAYWEMIQERVRCESGPYAGAINRICFNKRCYRVYTHHVRKFIQLSSVDSYIPQYYDYYPHENATRYVDKNGAKCVIYWNNNWRNFPRSYPWGNGLNDGILVRLHAKRGGLDDVHNIYPGGLIELREIFYPTDDVFMEAVAACFKREFKKHQKENPEALKKEYYRNWKNNIRCEVALDNLQDLLTKFLDE